MLEDRVLGIKEAFGIFYGDVDIDPVFGGAVVKLVHAIGDQPLMDEVQAFLRWLDQLVNLLLAEMLAIALMVWVGDWLQGKLQPEQATL